jgi:hypothetical protein
MQVGTVMRGPSRMAIFMGRVFTSMPMGIVMRGAMWMIRGMVKVFFTMQVGTVMRGASRMAIFMVRVFTSMPMGTVMRGAMWTIRGMVKVFFTMQVEANKRSFM